MGTARVTAVPAPTFEGFYAVAYPRIVGALLRVTRDRQEAEDVAQEAFSRLVPPWGAVSRYDNPEARVRGVAFRISTSRWRRAKTAAATVLRLGPPSVVPAPSDAPLTVAAIFARLSVQHRQVLVLHHGLGIPVDEIADLLKVAPGTVKSRLNRARAAAAAVSDDNADHNAEGHHD